MAGEVSDELAGPAPREEPRAELPVVTSRYTQRFRLITGALLGMGLGAAFAALIIATGTERPRQASWSAWHPADSGISKGAQEIANHVAPLYRLPTGDQLVGATGGSLKLKVSTQDLPVRIAISRDSAGRTISIIDGKGVLYTLCGLGTRCSINKGKSSPERFLLLRREALELALYTFRYIDDVKNVVVLMPPAPGKRPTNAMFFRHEQYQPALDHPLRATLPLPPPSINGLSGSPQATLIERLTGASVFRYSFEQGQDLSAFLVLNPAR